MGQNQINIALLGLGRIGQMHALNLINHPEFNLKYTFDIDKNLNKKLGRKYKSIPINNPNVAFNDKSIKCIFIATSTKTHLNYIDKAVRNKKVVFCEKPLDLSLKKINEYKKKLSKFNPKIQIGFNRRYDAGHNSLKKNLINGKIGKLEKKYKSIPINNPNVAFNDKSIKCIFIATSTKTHLNYLSLIHI